MLRILSTVCLLVVLCSSIEAKKSRATQNFHCNELLNIQIKTEFDASHIYLSLANHFSHDRVALEGFAKMMEKSWKEEIAHGEKLIDYVIKRGGNVRTLSVSAPLKDNKWSNMNVCEIVEEVLGLEMAVHDSLLQLHKCGGGEDPHLQDFLEEHYLPEQIEANKELADLLTKLERTTMHVNADGSRVPLCDGLGLHIIDKELAAKF